MQVERASVPADLWQAETPALPKFLNDTQAGRDACPHQKNFPFAGADPVEQASVPAE